MVTCEQMFSADVTLRTGFWCLVSSSLLVSSGLWSPLMSWCPLDLREDAYRLHVWGKIKKSKYQTCLKLLSYETASLRYIASPFPH